MTWMRPCGTSMDRCGNTEHNHEAARIARTIYGEEADAPCVYRIYGDTGRLLYIGQTVRRWKRLKQHRSQSTWWPWDYYGWTPRELAVVGRIVFEEHDSQRSALVAEARAIRAECPLFNIDRPNPEALAALFARQAES